MRKKGSDSNYLHNIKSITVINYEKCFDYYFSASPMHLNVNRVALTNRNAVCVQLSSLDIIRVGSAVKAIFQFDTHPIFQINTFTI